MENTLRTTTRTREGQEDEHGLADLHLMVRHGFEAVERVEERERVDLPARGQVDRLAEEAEAERLEARLKQLQAPGSDNNTETP